MTARPRRAVDVRRPGRHARDFVSELRPLLSDRDLLLIDPRGTGRSDPRRCGFSDLPAIVRAALAGNTGPLVAAARAIQHYTSGPFTDVPVLVTSGDLDPNTPTREGRQAARQFPNQRVIEVPNAGHVPEGEPSGCAASITFRFIRNQRVGDTSCLAKIPPVPVR
jgi:pimeloyl-ACP methyl ester carboxylesterase